MTPGVVGIRLEPERRALAGRGELLAVVHPHRPGVPGVCAAQHPVVRVVRDAGGGDEVGARAGALDQGRVGPAQQLAGVVGEGRRGGERRPHERCAPPGLQAMPDHVADDQQGGVLRALGDEVEVAADPLGLGGQEEGGQFQARAPGQLGRRERVTDRAQVLELVLRSVEALVQGRELLVVHRGFSPEPRDQRLLDVPLCLLMAHHSRGAAKGCDPIVSHRAPGVHARPRARRRRPETRGPPACDRAVAARRWCARARRPRGRRRGSCGRARSVRTCLMRVSSPSPRTAWTSEAVSSS